MADGCKSKCPFHLPKSHFVPFIFTVSVWFPCPVARARVREESWCKCWDVQLGQRQFKLMSFTSFTTFNTALRKRQWQPDKVLKIWEELGDSDDIAFCIYHLWRFSCFQLLYTFALCNSVSCPSWTKIGLKHKKMQTVKVRLVNKEEDMFVPLYSHSGHVCSCSKVSKEVQLTDIKILALADHFSEYLIFEPTKNYFFNNINTILQHKTGGCLYCHYQKEIFHEKTSSDHIHPFSSQICFLKGWVIPWGCSLQSKLNVPQTGGNSASAGDYFQQWINPHSVL